MQRAAAPILGETTRPETMMDPACELNTHLVLPLAPNDPAASAAVAAAAAAVAESGAAGIHSSVFGPGGGAWPGPGAGAGLGVGGSVGGGGASAATHLPAGAYPEPVFAEPGTPEWSESRDEFPSSTSPEQVWKSVGV